jgi:hypothetical protein
MGGKKNLQNLSKFNEHPILGRYLRLDLDERPWIAAWPW